MHLGIIIQYLDDKVRVGSALLPIEEERGSDDSSQWDVAIKAMQWLPEVLPILRSCY